MRSAALAFVFAFAIGCGESVVDGACATGYLPCNGRCALTCGELGDSGASRDADTGTMPDTDTGSGADATDALPDGGDGAVDALVEEGLDCPGSLVDCSGVCVDLDVDPLNCGACGNVCPTGLCNGGKCRGARSGHIVAIGHDYVASSAEAPNKTLINAAFLPSRNPVRIAVLTEFADPVAVARVDAILTSAAATSGRTFVRTPVSVSTAFLDKLNVDSLDVALVLDQKAAADGKLATAGVAAKATFASFTKAGGVVVVLDGGSGQMPAYLSAAALLDVSGHTSFGGKLLEVVDPADAIGIDVLSPFLSPSGTAAFDLVMPLPPLVRIVVAGSAGAAPVVIHRVVKP